MKNGNDYTQPRRRLSVIQHHHAEAHKALRPVVQRILDSACIEDGKIVVTSREAVDEIEGAPESAAFRKICREIAFTTGDKISVRQVLGVMLYELFTGNGWEREEEFSMSVGKETVYVWSVDEHGERPVIETFWPV